MEQRRMAPSIDLSDVVGAITKIYKGVIFRVVACMHATHIEYSSAGRHEKLNMSLNQGVPGIEARKRI